jgi:hypothetical protein
VAFLRCPKGVAGSLKREVWLYDKVNKQIFIEKLETVDCITLVCPFEDVDDMCNQFAETFLELASECISRQLLLDLMTNVVHQINPGINMYQGPTPQRNVKNIIETRIYVYIKNRETELIFNL